MLQGQGTFIDDMQLQGMLHTVVVRSPHARIQSIDAASAQALPGVITVLTARELAGKVRHIPRWVVPDLDEVEVPEHLVLATDRVCYVGQPVAAIVAEDRGVAEDAADELRIAYSTASAEPARDADEDTSTLLHDVMGTNVALRLQLGRGDVDATFARADRIVRGRYEVPRISAAPMECRGLVAQYHPEDERLTLCNGFCWSQKSVLNAALSGEMLTVPIPDNIDAHRGNPDDFAGDGIYDQGPVYTAVENYSLRTWVIISP